MTNIKLTINDENPVIATAKSSDNDNVEYLLWECHVCHKRKVLARYVYWYDSGDARTNGNVKIIVGKIEDYKPTCNDCAKNPFDYIDSLENANASYKNLAENLGELKDAISTVESVFLNGENKGMLYTKPQGGD